MKTSVTADTAQQDLLFQHMYDQAKVGLMEHLESDRAGRKPYWENAVALMVVHLTAGALESFVNAVLHLAEYWRQPRLSPVTSDDVSKLIDKHKATVDKWKWLGRRASGDVWFDKGKEPMRSYVALVQLRNDLADHDKAPILRESEGWTNDRRKHLVDRDLTQETAARAIVTVTAMVTSLREAFLAGDSRSPVAADPAQQHLWKWACVKETEILRLAGRNETPVSAW